MPRRIEIDDDVFAALQRHAEPLVDTPNDVLRRLLSLDNEQAEQARRAQSTRASEGSGSHPARVGSAVGPERERARRGAGELLPLEQYCGPILQALTEAGGELRSREIPAKVAPYVEGLLYDADRDLNGEGAPAWHGRIGWAGTLCRKDGHLDKDAPRGTWRLTAAGREEAAKAERS